MNVAVLGADGMLGSQVVRIALTVEGLSAVVCRRRDVDITDIATAEKMVDAVHPDVIINCAGIVKSRDVSKATFMAVNAEAPQVLADLCDKRDIRFIQVSTDCVFAGDGPHDEDDEPTATEIYGLSKAAGEIDMGGRHLTVRCSFVGIGERGLLNWLAHQKGEVDGYVNVLWNGLVAGAAAKCILHLGLRTNATGLIHIYGPDTTKYHVLRAANEVFGLGLTIRPVDAPVADFRLRTHNEAGFTVGEDIATHLASKEIMG